MMPFAAARTSARRFFSLAMRKTDAPEQSGQDKALLGSFRSD
jgi:hypothetical protein